MDVLSYVLKAVAKYLLQQDLLLCSIWVRHYNNEIIALQVRNIGFSLE